MKCTDCGKRVKKTETVCPHCGKTLAVEAMDTQELIDVMGEIHDEFSRIGEMREKVQDRRRRMRIAAIVTAIILACVGAGWGTMYYIKGVQEKAQQVAQEEMLATPSAVSGETIKTFLGKNFVDVSVVDENSAKTALESVKSQLGIVDTSVSFRLDRATTIGSDTYYRFVQVWQGVDVYGGEAILLADASGTPIALNARLIETDGLEVSANLDKGKAGNAISEYVNKMIETYRVEEGVQISQIQKTVCNYEGKTYLAYTANISGYNVKGEFVGYDVFVDADNGAGICVFDTASFENSSGTPAKPKIYGIYTVNEKFNWNLSDKTGMIEEIPIADIESGNATPYISGAKAAVDGAYNYFVREHGWVGLDGKTGEFSVYLNANEYVKDNLPPENALYHNGVLMLIEPDMATGTVDANVVAHEYAHGVMQHIAGLAGTNAKTENAAIAEALADIFGELAEGTSPDWIHKERRFLDVQAGYHYETGEGISIVSVEDCYRYSTILSRAAYKMYAEGIGTKKLGELLFRSVMMMTGYDGFADFGTIVELNAKVMMDNGTLSDVQFGIVTTALTNSGMRGERLYQTEIAELSDENPTPEEISAQ